MDVRILGVVEAVSGETVVALGARKQKAVLAMLAMEANTPVSADRIAEGLWGESLPPSAHKMVQLYIHQLRKVLRDTGADAEIVTRGRGYELVCGDDDVDVHRAERLLEAALAEAVPNGHAREALSLWRGGAGGAGGGESPPRAPDPRAGRGPPPPGGDAGAVRGGADPAL